MSLTEPRTTQHRLALGVIAVAASVLLSGCPIVEPSDGDFPKLEAALASIDWTGDGTAPPAVGIQVGARLPIRASFEYHSGDAAALQLEIENRLKSLDSVFTVTVDRETNARFEGDNLEIHVALVDSAGDSPSVSINVETSDDEDAALKSLAPIIEVFGTTP